MFSGLWRKSHSSGGLKLLQIKLTLLKPLLELRVNLFSMKLITKVLLVFSGMHGERFWLRNH